MQVYINYQMSNQQKPQKPQQNNSNISDDLEELQQDSSYEKTNQIFTLNSEINALKKQNQKLSLDYQAKIKTLENKYEKLANQANQRKIENSNFVATVTRLERENEQLKNIIETHRGQLENGNRRTADFHRSIEEFKDAGLGDPTDLIGQLLSKDNQIQKLKQVISELESIPHQAEVTPPSSFEQKEQISSLREKVEELRKKQIAYKKQYQSMLQSKEDIIKKMVSQNEDSSRRTNESKDKRIAQLSKEIDENKRWRQELSREVKELGEKIIKYEQMIAKNKSEFAKKQQELKYSFELEKENIIKALQQKSKKTLMQKQQKHSVTQVNLATAENQLLINKQELSKLKAQLASATQYNSYLESANRQLEEGKKKMQTALYNKEEEIIEIKDKCFMEISEVKRKMMEERRSIESKLYQVQEELLAKKYMLEKYERVVEQKNLKSANENASSEYALLGQIQILRSEKAKLQKQVAALEETNKLKTETYIELQKTLRETYETRIQSLQTQKQSLATHSLKQKQQIIGQSSQAKETLEQKYHKLQMVCELLELEKEQKSKEYKQIVLAKIKLEENVKQLEDKKLVCENKIKENKEDYTALEVMYEELNEKYKTGVKDLEKEIHHMSLKIDEESKKAEKRKTQGNKTAIASQQQLQQARERIRLLEKQVEEEIKKKQQQQQENQQLKEQFSKINRELSATQRQRETLHRSHTRTLTQTHHTHEHEKQALLEYIQELEQNIHILNTKLALNSNKQQTLLSTISQLDRELKNIKIEYSQSLEQIKELLGKCKQLEELNKQATSHRQAIKHNYELNCQRFEESSRQKIQQELESAYDQINKLNKVLMNKEEQLSKSRVVYETAYGSSQHNLRQTPNTSNAHFIGQSPYIVSGPASRTYLVSTTPTKDNTNIYSTANYEHVSPLVSQKPNIGANSYKVRFNRIS